MERRRYPRSPQRYVRPFVKAEKPTVDPEVGCMADFEGFDTSGQGTKLSFRLRLLLT